MLIQDLRLTIFGAVLSELYRGCGLFPTTKNNTTAKVSETEGGTSFFGQEFNLVFNSKKSENANNEIVVCDICFDEPSEQFINNFYNKLTSVRKLSNIKFVGFIVFTEKLSSELAEYANSLSVYTVSYGGNPIITPILDEINYLCRKYTYKDLLNDSSINLRHEIAGYLQSYYPLILLQSKPYFVDGFQVIFMSIKQKLSVCTTSMFAVTSGNYLLHLLSSDEINIGDSCKIATRTKNGDRYKALIFNGDTASLSFTLPTAISKCKLFGNDKYLIFKTVHNFRAKAINVPVE